ncbi:hypothetical protein [Luteipulveratus mongoliensis]|uniref:hypothetical protein n=1 Tax=Luteipulveratus mongoliensis TaxID=571913 RepID=UPI0012EE4923|nr:hypothetical protein [Luteipulveratus mongoliensis]
MSQTSNDERILLHAHGHHIVQAVNSVVSIVGGDQITLLDRPQRPHLPPTASVARLLRPRSTPVPFVNRSGVIDDLQRWATTNDPFAIRILGGAGGTGKTRLATELCITLNELTPPTDATAWLAGFLPSDVAPSQLDGLAALPAPRLIVIDYAENRPEQLRRLLPALHDTAVTHTPARVLLLVRRPAPLRPSLRSQASAWVDAVRADDEAADIVIDTATETVLDTTPLTPSEKAALFSEAVAAFSLCQEGSSTEVPDPDLDDRLYAQPLTVLMAAFLSARGTRIPSTREAMFDAILGHEERHWRATWKGNGFPIDDESLAEAVALATLTSTTNAAEALRLLSLLPDSSDRPERELRRIDS